MTIRKKLAAVSAALCMVFAMFMCMTALTTVHAAEAETANSLAQVVPNTAAQDQEEESAIVNEVITLTQDEIPMAEAKVSVLETQTEEKGMSSILAFGLVAAAALATGIAVALRAKFGRKKRCYVPADDMTFFKMKK